MTQSQTTGGTPPTTCGSARAITKVSGGWWFSGGQAHVLLVEVERELNPLHLHHVLHSLSRLVLLSGGAKGRRAPLLVAGGLVVLALGGAGIGWSVSAVFAAPADVLAETPFTFVELVDGEVGGRRSR